jgi:hypothetical protein
MAGAAECSKLRLESFHFRAQNKLAVIQDPRDRCVDCGPKPTALSGNINERNGWGVGTQIHLLDVRTE